TIVHRRPGCANKSRARCLQQNSPIPAAGHVVPLAERILEHQTVPASSEISGPKFIDQARGDLHKKSSAGTSEINSIAPSMETLFVATGWSRIDSAAERRQIIARGASPWIVGKK